MLNTLLISDKAQIVYWELLEWYGKIDIRLSIQFADEYFQTLNKILQYPTHYSFIAPNIRRCLFPKMNCMILYEFEDGIVRVLLLKDTRSKPNENFY